MKILLSTYVYYPSVGGTETIVADLAEHFVRAGHDITITCAHDSRRTDLYHRGARIVEFSYTGIMAEGSHQGNITEYQNHIREEKYDVAFIICEPIHWCLFGAPLDDATRLVAVPCINEETLWRIRHLPTVEKQIAYYLRQMDGVIAMTSEGPDAQFLRSQKISFECIPNGIPFLAPTPGFFSLRGVRTDLPVILHPANFQPLKNHNLTLDLAARLEGHARIVMMGSITDHPDYAHTIEERAARLGNVTVLHGCSRKDVASALSESTLMILPSFAEGAPLAVLEAMAQGIPFIMSDRIGSRSDVRGGSVVPVEQFIEEVDTLLGDSLQREKLGKEGKETFRSLFRIEAVAERYLAFAKKILAPLEEESWHKISFCIITNGKHPKVTKKAIAAIRKQQIPHYEIIIAGIWKEEEGLKVLTMTKEAEEGLVSQLRNAASEHAQYETLCLLDDDVLLNDGWYDGIIRYGSDFDVLCCRLYNPDGTRCWDWVSDGGVRGHTLLEEWDDDWYVYPTGASIVMRRSVWERIRWNDELRHGEAEESEYARRIKREGFRISFNPHSAALHADARYRQEGMLVVIDNSIERNASAEEAQNFHEHARRKTLEQRVSAKVKKTWGKILANRPKSSRWERQRAYNEIQKLLIVQTGSLAETLAMMMVVRRIASFSPSMKVGFLGPNYHGDFLRLLDTVTCYSSRPMNLFFSLRALRKEKYDVVLNSSFDHLEYGATLARLAAPDGYTIGCGASRYGWLFDYLEQMVITSRDSSHTANIFSFVAARALCADEEHFLPMPLATQKPQDKKRLELVIDGEGVCSGEVTELLTDHYGRGWIHLDRTVTAEERLEIFSSAKRILTNDPAASMLASTLNIPCIVTASSFPWANRWYPFSHKAVCVMCSDGSLASLSGMLLADALTHLDQSSGVMRIVPDPEFQFEKQMMERLVYTTLKDREAIVQ